MAAGIIDLDSIPIEPATATKLVPAGQIDPAFGLYTPPDCDENTAGIHLVEINAGLLAANFPNTVRDYMLGLHQADIPYAYRDLQEGLLANMGILLATPLESANTATDTVKVHEYIHLMQEIRFGHRTLIHSNPTYQFIYENGLPFDMLPAALASAGDLADIYLEAQAIAESLFRLSSQHAAATIARCELAIRTGFVSLFEGDRRGVPYIQRNFYNHLKRGRYDEIPDYEAVLASFIVFSGKPNILADARTGKYSREGLELAFLEPFSRVLRDPEYLVSMWSEAALRLQLDQNILCAEAVFNRLLTDTDG